MSSFPPPPPPPRKLQTQPPSTPGGGYAAQKFPGGAPPPPSRGGPQGASAGTPTTRSASSPLVPNNTNNVVAKKSLPSSPGPGKGGFPPPPPSSSNNSKFPPPSPRTQLSSTANTGGATPLSSSRTGGGVGPASPSPVRPTGYQTPQNTNNNNNNPTSSKFPPPPPSNGTMKAKSISSSSFPPPSPVTTTATGNSASSSATSSNLMPSSSKRPAPLLKNFNTPPSQDQLMNNNKEPPKMLSAKTSAGIGQTITHLKSPPSMSATKVKSQQQGGGMMMGTSSNSNGGGSGRNTPRSHQSSMNSTQFLPASQHNKENNQDNNNGETPLVMFCPVSISISANGQVIRANENGNQIESSSLYDVMNSSDFELGQRYAAQARSVTNSLQVNEKEGTTTKPEIVTKAVEEIANNSNSSGSSIGSGSSGKENVLSLLLKHMINGGKENAENWASDIVSKYVPILDRFCGGNTEADINNNTNLESSLSSSQLPCPSKLKVLNNNNGNSNAPDQIDENNDGTNASSSIKQKREASQAIQDCIISGDRAKAVQIALENGLYSEALLTSMLCDKDVYVNAVQTFIEHNIDRSSPLGQAFMLFNELPLSSPETLNVNHWAHHIKMLLCNYSAAGLTDGVTNWSDALVQHNMVDEAHMCLLLLQQSPAWQNSNVVPENIRNRIHLLTGVYRKHGCRKAFMNFRSLFLSDAMEYSKQRSINEKFIRPPLIPFKLAHGMLLQELGLLEKAGTYFDTVTRILRPGTPKELTNPKLWDRNATGQVPASLFQLNEICKFTLNQYFKPLEGREGGAKDSSSGGSNATTGSSAGILGWFGIGGKKATDQQDAAVKKEADNNNNNNNTDNNSNKQITNNAENNITTNLDTEYQQPHQSSNNNNNNNFGSSINRSASAPAPHRGHNTEQNNNANDQQQQHASSQARAPSQSRVGAMLSSIGGLFRKAPSKSEDPPPKAMILDSEPVPEWDPVNKCYKRKLTAEEQEIERITKAGPPKVDPMANKKENPVNNSTSGNGYAQMNSNNNNNIQQQRPNTTSSFTPGPSPAGPGVPLGGGKRPPGDAFGGAPGMNKGPPPAPNRHSAVGRSRYADVFNG